jgi:hypothetical protein
VKLGWKLKRRKLGTKTTFDPKIIASLAFKPDNQFIFFLRKTLLQTRIRQDLTQLLSQNA